MVRKTFLALALSLLVASPSTGWCRYHHGGAALAWGLSGFFLGSALTAAVYRPPPPVVYAYGPPPAYVYGPPPPVYRARVYGYAPSVPPGMCRWERYVLDGYGNTVLDYSGRPVKEYTLGSCQQPPY